MRQYYEILDSKLWAKHDYHGHRDWRPKARPGETNYTFKIIVTMMLAFLFWGLSETPGAHYTRILSFIGWFFAFQSLWLVVKSRFEGSRI